MREGWVEKRLGDVCKLDKQKHDGVEFPYIGMEHIESGGKGLAESPKPTIVKSSTFRFGTEHVLYGRLRPYLNKVFVPDIEGHCSTEIFPIKCVREALERQFLFYWLISSNTVKKLEATSTGARMPRANVKAMLDFHFPLPPLPEQKQIVAILDKAFTAIDQAVANAERNLTNARELFESYLNKVFTERGEGDGVREGWVEKPLGELLQKTGTIDPRKTPEKEFHYVDVSSVSRSTFSIEETNCLKGSDAPSRARRLIRTGDVLFATIRPTLQRVAIVPEWLDGEVCSTGYFVLRSLGEVNNRFLYYYLFTKGFMDEMERRQKGASYPAVNDGDVREQLLWFPPLPEQKQIVAELDALSANTKQLETIYQQKLTTLTELKQSILQKAFRGELTEETALQQVNG